MGHRKLGLFLLLLLFQLHILRASSHFRQNHSVIAVDQEQYVIGKGIPENLSIKVGVKREISVDRRGGGGGGHGGGHGGHSGGRGSHGASGKARGYGEGSQGTKSPYLQAGGAVIPLYAAGAMNHHPINHHHNVVPQNVAFNQEQNVMDKGMPEKLSINVGVKDEISIDRRGGGAGGHGGGHGGSEGDGGKAHGGGEGTKSPLQGGVVIPLYAAGAMNHRIYHHFHGSGATLNHIGLRYLVFATLASLVYIIV